jgi:WXG100 family type VII secretion target
MPIKVDYGELESSASQLRNAQQEIEGRLSQLQSMINNLMSSGFTTEIASGKFSESYKQWNDGAKKVTEGLNGMNTFLNKAIQEHKNLDASLGQATGG